MKVVNVKAAQFGSYVYTGRKNGSEFPESVFSNPFHVGKDGDRDEVIRRFRLYLWGRMKASRLFRAQLMELDRKDLGCWCAPSACHCDILIRAIDWLKVNGNSFE